MLMTRGWLNGLVFLAAGVAMGGQGILAAERDGAPNAARVRLLAKMPGPRPDDPKPAKTMAQQFASIRAEYDAAEKTASAEAEKGKSGFESWKIYGKLMPDQAVFSRRMVDLAATEPKDPAARDALLWVIDKPGMAPAGPYSDEFTRAVLLLIRHHADDPEVARVGLGLDNLGSPARDMFLEGLYIRAKGHETKGLATVALGQYLEMKAKAAAVLRNAKGPAQTKMRTQTFDQGGKLVEKEFELPQEQLAWHLHLRMTDPEAVRSEARRLFDEVIKNYGDVPYVTRNYRELEALLKQPTPSWNGRPLTPEERKQGERMLAHKKTLADVAKAKIDEMENLVAGKPAPAIDGTGMDGKPLKLADYRGRVVVLVFWGTWCGPCMQEVPHERELAERYKGRPFALLGVDCESDKAAALKVMKEQGITWPNWNDGDPGEGPIAQTYHVRGYPDTFVIDARGVIRHQHLLGSGLDKAVDELIKEAETPVAGK
jgi:thiol-disulfide isomerase/thioredoxin